MIDQEARRPVDYSEALSPEDFRYFVTYAPGSALGGVIERDIVGPAMAEARSRYGIVVEELPWGQVPQVDRPAHVLVVPEPGARLSCETERYLGNLSSLPNGRINLVASYSFGFEHDPAMTEAVEATVRARDERLGVNSIFPTYADALYYGYRTVPTERVVDNLVCETIRAKCWMERTDDPVAETQLLAEQARAQSTIDSLRHTFAEYGLWHRARTDGAVMLPTSDEAWLVSQTRTDKTEMGTDHFSLVTGFDETAESIQYVGRKIPSSDSPELLVVLSALRKHGIEPGLAVHFHQNEVTRGGRFPDQVTKNAIEYGQFGSGWEILYELLLQRGRTGESWLVLKDHGVIWFGESAESFEDFVSRRLGLFRTER